MLAWGMPSRFFTGVNGSYCLTLRRYGSDHPIARGELQGEAAEFFREVIEGVASDVIIARTSTWPRVAGWFRYDREADMLHAVGTWVEPGYRDCGLAQALWAHAIRRERPKRIEVCTVSADGRKFVAGLLPRYPRMTFEVAA